MCEYTPIYSTIYSGWTLVCFWFGAVRNMAAMNILVCAHSCILGHVWGHTKTCWVIHRN